MPIPGPPPADGWIPVKAVVDPQGKVRVGFVVEAPCIVTSIRIAGIEIMVRGRSFELGAAESVEFKVEPPR